jgi:hypothetical protein
MDAPRNLTIRPTCSSPANRSCYPGPSLDLETEIASTGAFTLQEHVLWLKPQPNEVLGRQNRFHRALSECDRKKVASLNLELSERDCNRRSTSVEVALICHVTFVSGIAAFEPPRLIIDAAIATNDASMDFPQGCLDARGAFCAHCRAACALNLIAIFDTLNGYCSFGSRES